MLRILIIYCDYGRLCNRLHTQANALAWCIENNYSLINLSFDVYAHLFRNSRKHNSGNLNQHENFIFTILSSGLFRKFIRRLLLSDKWLKRLAWVIKQIKPSDNEILRETDLNRQINQKKINLVKYWDISCTNSLQTHENKVRDYLNPSKKFIIFSENIINELRFKFDCIVGVHARRGDYATYKNGLHYHSWESYFNWANQIKRTLEQSGKKNVGIVICSDEEPPNAITKGQTFYFSLANDFMIDIHLLSLCDYNLGPPSSFGTWISWFGKVPRLVVYDNTKITSLEQFDVCTTC